ncbi:MAG: hypothetical protein LVQ96_04060 [Thermoplasmatales archaeon]|nr:hypothetical protein [Thermoplasmatales archaeon]
MNRKSNNDILVVRKINKKIYKKFKQKAQEESKNIGEALNQAMSYWLTIESKAKQPDIRKLLKLNGIVKVDHTVNWSEDVDEILYGKSS